MAKALTPRRAPGAPLAEPGPVQKPPRRKSRKTSLRRSKGREAGRTPGGGPRAVVARPPKAPEDFSRNWRALREVRAAGPRAGRAGGGSRRGRAGRGRPAASSPGLSVSPDRPPAGPPLASPADGA